MRKLTPRLADESGMIATTARCTLDTSRGVQKPHPE